MTRVAATTNFPVSQLEISPAQVTSGGYPGGAFSPELFTLTLENTGGISLNWSLSNLPSWLTPSATNSVIPPYGSQNLMLALNENAELMPAGEHTVNLSFENCTGGGDIDVPFTLFIADEITCSGSLVELGPPPDVNNAYLDAHQCSLSVFIRPMKHIEVCAIGIQSTSTDPQVIVGRVYESDGFNRQTMIGEVWHPTVQNMEGFKLVPMDVTLKACHDYEIEFCLPSNVNYIYYDEAEFAYAFDVGGVIRITQGGSGGDYAGTRLPAIAIFGYNPRNRGYTVETDLLIYEIEGTEFAEQRGSGLFITAQDNLELCSAEFEANLPIGSHLKAWLWTAAGNVRQDFITEGHIRVGSTGMIRHEVPLHARLEYGQDYHIEFMFWDGGTYTYVDEGIIPIPFTSSDGAVLVRKGSYWGGESARLPQIWFNWSDFAASGVQFDLAKASDGIPPPYTSTNPLDHGMFMSTNVTQQVFGLGVKADIPEGSILFARVYNTIGAETPRRGSLASEGWIYTGKEGMQWHSIPLAIELRSSRFYDLSIVCSTVNEFDYWEDTSGLPYSPYGLYEVEDAEIAGSRSGTELIHMRIYACADEPTAVEEKIPSFTQLYLSPPIPNPAGGEVIFRYSMDQAGKADMALYDVLGRRVATVFSSRMLQSGPGSVAFNTTGLASGVYFVKLAVPGRAGVTQKMVVQR
jgi:hypothetical protein